MFAVELLKTKFINYGIKSKNINEDFSMLVLRHRYLIEHAELLADVISIVLLVQVLFSCLIISLIGKYLLISMFLRLLCEMRIISLQNCKYFLQKKYDVQYDLIKYKIFPNPILYFNITIHNITSHKAGKILVPPKSVDLYILCNCLFFRFSVYLGVEIT